MKAPSPFVDFHDVVKASTTAPAARAPPTPYRMREVASFESASSFRPGSRKSGSFAFSSDTMELADMYTTVPPAIVTTEAPATAKKSHLGEPPPALTWTGPDWTSGVRATVTLAVSPSARRFVQLKLLYPGEDTTVVCSPTSTSRGFSKESVSTDFPSIVTAKTEGFVCHEICSEAVGKWAACIATSFFSPSATVTETSKGRRRAPVAFTTCAPGSTVRRELQSARFSAAASTVSEKSAGTSAGTMSANDGT